MAVYIDGLTVYPRSRAWPYGASCHLWADTEEELDVFAVSIGCKPRWKQRGGSARYIFIHYDLTAKMRQKAIEAGAVEQLLADHIRQKRLPPRKAWVY